MMNKVFPIQISDSNSKLGRIPNISLIPVKDCGNCDHCRKDCYALKAWKQYAGVRKAWGMNSKAFRADPFAAIENVRQQLRAKRTPPKYFRIHVAGDFLNQDHVDAWCLMAGEFQATKFLAFTKMHDLNYDHTPSNLQIIMSVWPSMSDGEIDAIPGDLPKAWVQDGTETRIPKNAIECPGQCDTCGMCWQLSKLDRDVTFDAH